MLIGFYLRLLTPKFVNHMTILNKKDVVVSFAYGMFTEGLLGKFRNGSYKGKVWSLASHVLQDPQRSEANGTWEKCAEYQLSLVIAILNISKRRAGLRLIFSLIH